MGHVLVWTSSVQDEGQAVDRNTLEWSELKTTQGYLDIRPWHTGISIRMDNYSSMVTSIKGVSRNLGNIIFLSELPAMCIGARCEVSITVHMSFSIV